MNNALCRLTGAEFPLFAFSHCRDVVAAVSRAGGFGVLGASSFTPEELEIELSWIDDHVDGRPYGVDILFPEHQSMDADDTEAAVAQRISPAHRNFVVDLLAQHQVPMTFEETIDPAQAITTSPDMSERLLDIAFQHPIRLIANALGLAPPAMLERARQRGVPVAALIGAKNHAIRQAQAGVDILIAQGTEAAGHCGEVSTLVLLAETIRAVRPIRDIPVLAAGGIVTGEQMAGCMAIGAQGVWTGSVWMATTDASTSEIFRQKLVRATSRDTLRSKCRTGKPGRQLRSAWHDAWEANSSPGTLPMPQMGLLAEPAFSHIEQSAAGGNREAVKLVSHFVGQGIGLIEEVLSATTVVQQFKEEFANAVGAFVAMLEEA